MKRHIALAYYGWDAFYLFCALHWDACVCIHMHVCLKGLMFECTSRMGYNDRLSATTAAGIFRMSLSTYINGETRTRDKIQDSYTLQDTEIGCNPKKVGVLCKM